MNTLKLPGIRLYTLILTGFLLISSVNAAPVPVPTAPSIAARGYILLDSNSGHILAKSKIDKRMEPASLTKLLTAYIVFTELRAGTITLDEKVRISEKAWRTGGSRMFIEVNSNVSIEELLQGMIIQSGNDASVALAEHIAGSEEAFASLMNSYAQNLNMTKSHFVNSTGMPHRKHYTTINDLAILSRAIVTDFPEYYKWYSVKEYTYNGIKQFNRNKLLWRDKQVDGLKTGHTESAGYNLISSAKRDDMRLVSIVLGTKSEEARARESQKLLNYGFRFFETRPLYQAHASLDTTRVWKGSTETLPLGIEEDLFITIPRGRYKKLDAKMNIPNKIIAPVKKGQVIGSLEIILEGNLIAQRPLVALSAIPEGDIFQRLMDEAILLFQ